jgi:hypothetical protein
MPTPSLSSIGMSTSGRVATTPAVVSTPANRWIEPVNHAYAFEREKYFVHWNTDPASG